MKKRQKFFRKIVGLLVVLTCVAGVTVYKKSFFPAYPEIKTLEEKTMDFRQLSVFFTKLSQAKGAAYAYEVLKIAPLPPNTDMHLLGHVVGDELYKQQGIEGMRICTQDFRNACSHSIVVGYFLKHGEAGFPDIAEACRTAPGGVGAYTMCFHGLGHGILAAVDYDLERTVGLCEKTGTAQYSFRESAECVGGAVMEIISGGFHNKTLWQQQSQKFLSTASPLMPCTAEYMADENRSMCLEYLTPHLITAAGGSLNEEAIPSDEVIQKAFRFCEELQRKEWQYACYQGFGKEFIVLVHQRDTRTLADMPNSEMQEVFRLCGLSGVKEGETACLLHALDSLYWGGENDSKGAIRFCGLMTSSNLKDQCFQHLIGAMKFFVKDDKKREAFCRDIPQAYISVCNDE